MHKTKSSHLAPKQTTIPFWAKWEWPTLGLMVLCFVLWAGAVVWLSAVSTFLSMAVLVFALVLHSSLSHEVLHGHPFPSRRAGEAMMIVQPGLFIPYIRFRDTHLAHHMDARLTDPYDDPESNYMDPSVWRALSAVSKLILRANNTLLGRMVLGPLVSQWSFMRSDLAAILQGNKSVAVAWALHFPGVVLVLMAVHHAGMSVWLYVFSAYLALSVLKIRTFLEHQAHLRASGRSVIIEDRSVLSFLFLNNNLHFVHHMHPRVAWYNLPALYWGNRTRYVKRNDGYVYKSYRDVFRRYLLKTKDPVAHPLWPK